jgi:hypothetical protein
VSSEASFFPGGLPLRSPPQICFESAAHLLPRWDSGRRPSSYSVRLPRLRCSARWRWGPDLLPLLSDLLVLRRLVFFFFVLSLSLPPTSIPRWNRPPNPSALLISMMLGFWITCTRCLFLLYSSTVICFAYLMMDLGFGYCCSCSVTCLFYVYLVLLACYVVQCTGRHVHTCSRALHLICMLIWWWI